MTVAGFSKVFSTMWGGSLYGRFEASAVFMVFLSLSDRDGNVDMTPEAIAGVTGWPLTFINQGIAELAAPDPRSRTPDEEGRRIILLDEHREWGWKITNYAKYREEMRSQERREYLREAKRKERASTPVNKSTNVNHVQPIADADADADADAERLLSAAPTTVDVVFEHWRETWGHPRARLDDKRRKTITAALKTYSGADLCQSITGYRNSPHHMGQNDRSTVYDSIELFLKDARHIDAGLKFYENPPSNHSKLTRLNVDRTAEWAPPEVRNARN